MTAPAIRIEGLWKEYVIGGAERAGQTFREALVDSVAAPFRRLAGRREGDAPERRFWALKDVSFDIGQGEVVGIIGRNGAGKSTLLKILSRITAPTRGRIEVRGRIASLLEVGTGFHPELTGRENIRLNGAILGMSGAEIHAKFDEIVDFAGVERFIDTPVKRYSSGMQVRLAFAVAAHLDPEILLVDEVLAVGDAEFQKKCLGKMGEIAGRGGRTVLFVSHQLGLVAQLCVRGVVLSQGRLVEDAPVRRAIDSYLSDMSNSAGQTLVTQEFLDRSVAAVVRAETCGSDKVAASDFAWDQSIVLRIDARIKETIPGLCCGVAIQNRMGTTVTTWVKKVEELTSARVGDLSVGLEIESGVIAPGSYSFVVALFVPNGPVYHKLESICPVMLHDAGSAMAAFSHIDYGVVILPAQWSAKAA